MSVHAATVAPHETPAPSGNAADACKGNPNRAVFDLPVEPLPAHALPLDDLALYIRHYLPNQKDRLP